MRHTLLLGTALLLAVAAGCSRAPGVGEPVAPSELPEIVDSINSGVPAADSFRGSGDGSIRVSGRTIDVAFAVVYERPGWLRADLRPAVGTLGASLTTLALMEGECARLYLPARLLVVTGCVSDVAGYADWGDPASLVLGLPDASFITRMTDARASRGRGVLNIDGVMGESLVHVEVDESLPAITEIELGREGSDDALRLSYGGHGWKAGTTVPRTVELTALEGTSREINISIRYDKLRGDDPVDREAYDLGVPPGALEINWQELDIWR